MKYTEMNIDEMKKVKNTWQIHLKIFTRKLQRLSAIEQTKENMCDIKQLEMSYTYCIDAIHQIISIYKKLIDLGENCELDEKYFIDKINEIKRLHTNFRIEANKYNNLAKKYFISIHTKKDELNF